MNRLIISFQTVKSYPSLLHKLMGKGLKSEVYHAELRFSGENPCRFSAWQDFGTGFREMDNIGDDWHWIHIDLGSAYYEKVLAFAKSQQGLGYNLSNGYRTAMDFTEKPDNSQAWYCSEVVYATLVYAGFPLRQMSASQVLPSTLYDMIDSLYPR